jgi:Helitron helicase-like domain at N-terminus
MHHSYPFVAFSIQQKQLALLSEKIHMCWKNFEADLDLLAELSFYDLQEAQVDEENHRVIWNEGVWWLHHYLCTSSSHIMASGKMQASYRSQIWGTCLWLGPPSLWLTINPMNYEDPIAQILVGEEINMDLFMEFMGPEPSKHARNVAKDPFASV